MNQEQVKSSIRWFVASFGAGIAGFIAGKGWASADTIMAALSSPVFISIASSAAMGIWGLFVHTQANAVAVVGAIAAQPESAVKGVITTSTAEGRDLAQSIPGSTVAAAGSFDAKAIATPGA